jgi:hypothetical protein
MAFTNIIQEILNNFSYLTKFEPNKNEIILQYENKNIIGHIYYNKTKNYSKKDIITVLIDKIPDNIIDYQYFIIYICNDSNIKTKSIQTINYENKFKYFLFNIYTDNSDLIINYLRILIEKCTNQLIFHKLKKMRETIDEYSEQIKELNINNLIDLEENQDDNSDESQKESNIVLPPIIFNINMIVINNVLNDRNRTKNFQITIPDEHNIDYYKPNYKVFRSTSILNQYKSKIKNRNIFRMVRDLSNIIPDNFDNMIEIRSKNEEYILILSNIKKLNISKKYFTYDGENNLYEAIISYELFAAIEIDFNS